MKKIIIVHVQLYKNNFFVIFSNIFNNVLLKFSSGCVGFKNSKKCNWDSLLYLLSYSALLLYKYYNYFNIFLKIEGGKKKKIQKILNFFIEFLNIYEIEIIGLKIIVKIPHGGCKKSKN